MVKAIPITTNNKLRLYCLRVSDRILIIGGGEEKRVRAYQDDAALTRMVRVVELTGRQLIKSIQQGTTGSLTSLFGKLTFEIYL